MVGKTSPTRHQAVFRLGSTWLNESCLPPSHVFVSTLVREGNMYYCRYVGVGVLTENASNVLTRFFKSWLAYYMVHVICVELALSTTTGRRFIE